MNDAGQLDQDSESGPCGTGTFSGSDYKSDLKNYPCAQKDLNDFCQHKMNKK